MSRVEQIGNCTLYLADCCEAMKVMGGGQVMLTDPPYSEHVHSSNMRGLSSHQGKISERRELGFGSIKGEQMVALAAYAKEHISRWSAVFSDTESSHLWREAMGVAGLEYIRTSFWRKLNGAPQYTGDRPAVACEAINIFHPAGKKRWSGGGKQGFYEFPIVMDRGGPHHEVRVHTTQKPLALMAALVKDFTEVDDVVVDPFMGSGTTGVACVKMQRRFIGVEVDEANFEAACKRIRDTYAQPDMFIAPAKPMKQGDLL